MTSMNLELVVKYLKNENEGLLRGVLSSSKEHPIVYLNNDDFRKLDEYKILDFLAEKNYMEKEEKGSLIHFVLTKLGKERLFKEYRG